MRRQGIADLSKITTAELDAYLVLLRRTDNGRAFLKIMRGFELTRAKPRQTLPELITSRPRRDLMPGTRPVTGPLRGLSGVLAARRLATRLVRGSELAVGSQCRARRGKPEPRRARRRPG